MAGIAAQADDAAAGTPPMSALTNNAAIGRS